MRVNPNQYPAVDAALQKTELSLQTAENQLSSGKRVSAPSDDPLAFANSIQNLAAAATIDRYSKNADAVISQAQMSDSALSSVVTLLTQAISLGTQGGDGTLTSAQRSALAQQVQGLLVAVVAQANTCNGGHPLFAGTGATQTPFVEDATSQSGFVYQGSSDSNISQVGPGMDVASSVPGDAIFTNPNGNALESLRKLATALESGSTSDLATATSAVSAAITCIGQARAQYGSTVNQLTAEHDYLSQETISLKSQQTSLTDIDTATAAMNLTQAQTAHSAVLAMAAKILPESLLNYLRN